MSVQAGVMGDGCYLLEELQGYFLWPCGFMRLEALKTFHHIIPAFLDAGASGVLLAPRSGRGESSAFVNTDKNRLLRTSAFPLAYPTLWPSFLRDATPELLHFLF